jgi:hypothetical protein
MTMDCVADEMYFVCRQREANRRAAEDDDCEGMVSETWAGAVCGAAVGRATGEPPPEPPEHAVNPNAVTKAIPMSRSRKVRTASLPFEPLTLTHWLRQVFRQGRYHTLPAHWQVVRKD